VFNVNYPNLYKNSSNVTKTSFLNRFCQKKSQCGVQILAEKYRPAKRRTEKIQGVPECLHKIVLAQFKTLNLSKIRLTLLENFLNWINTL